jgi:hypothetical protein
MPGTSCTSTWGSVILALSVCLTFELRADETAGRHLETVRVPSYGTSWLKFPDSSAIIGVRCRLETHPFGISGIDEFEIPEREWESLLEYFRSDCEVEAAPTASLEIGSIVITTRDNQREHVLLLWSLGKQPLSFSIRGVRVRANREKWLKQADVDAVGDGSFQVYDHIREIHERSKRGKPQDDVGR